jgi:hypothetical protein
MEAFVEFDPMSNVLSSGNRDLHFDSKDDASRNNHIGLAVKFSFLPSVNEVRK